MAAPRIARTTEHWWTGGIIQRVEWVRGPDTVTLWSGRTEPVHGGDTVVLLRTGRPEVAVVAVERA